MNLDDTQRKQVSQWIAEGLKLSEIQSRLASELGVRMTYMDVRLLVDDLKLTPQDIEPPNSTTLASPKSGAATASVPNPATSRPATGSPPPSGRPGAISMSVDQLARP